MNNQISLKEYVKRTGIKQDKIAEILGVQSSTVSSWACGRYQPDITNIRALESCTGGQVGLYSPWGEELKKLKKAVDDGA